MSFVLHTERLVITEFTLSMSESVSLISLDGDNRRFLPDEVFETPEDAAEVISELMKFYENADGPLVYPILLEGRHIGHVEAVPIEGGWEVGYHIGASYTGKGYASEAVTAFLPVIMKRLGTDRIYGICDAENASSRRVLEKCGFTLEYEGIDKHHGKDIPIRRYV